MQPRKNRRMRCPNCKSLQTKRNGKRKITSVSFNRRTKREVQRYKCKSCKRTFSNRLDKRKRYTTFFKKEILRMHVEERMSYRVISKRLKEKLGIKVLAGRACCMANEIASTVKSSKQIKEEFNPHWSGYLVIDDKYINVKGKKQVSLIAVDSTGDPVHEELLPYQEQTNYDDFIRFIKIHLEYPFKAVTTDLDIMLEKSIKMVLGRDIPHQKCLRHAMENIKKIIDYPNKKRQYENLREQIHNNRQLNEDEISLFNRLENELSDLEELLFGVTNILHGSDRNKSTEAHKSLKFRFGNIYPRVFNMIEYHWEGLLAHQKDNLIPKTNNIAENRNRQIKRRLKTIEAFQSETYAFNYLILICNYLRFKPYTDCRNKRKHCNGKSPLELCGVVLKEKDWLKCSLNLY